MDGSQDSSRKEDYRRCRTGHEIHLEIEDDLYKKIYIYNFIFRQGPLVFGNQWSRHNLTNNFLK